MEVNNSSAVPVQGAENSSQPTGSAAAAAAATETPVSVPAPTCTGGKKKRGRPKKYGPDGTVIYHQAAALSPMPISASIPLTGDFPTWKPSRGRSIDSFKKKHKLLEFESPGERLAYSVGANFTPHVLTVNAGEDVNMKVISFSQQGSRAICILSANGAVSNVTLRQPNSSGGTLTYEGRFEILSLTGSFMPTDTGGTKSRTGGMSVSLAGPDGRVYGGGLAGLLIAAGPVQVVIGSFLPGHHQEQKPKKPRFEPNSTIYSPSLLNHQSGEAVGGSFGGQHRVIPNSVHVPNSLPSENVIHFQGSESNDHNRSPKFDVFQGSESNDHNRSPKFDVFQGSESNDHNRSPKFNIFQGSESNDHNRSSKFDVFQGAESNDHNRSSKFDVFQGSESTDHNRSPKFNISC